MYTSQSLSLAQLESWMHVAPQQPLPSYVTVSAEIPDDLAIHSVEETELPAGLASGGTFYGRSSGHRNALAGVSPPQWRAFPPR